MPGLATLDMVEAEVNATGGPASSIAIISPQPSGRPNVSQRRRVVHWHIENAQHWVLDTTFDEDRARTGATTAGKPGVPRRLAINVLRSARPDISIHRKRKRSGWSDDFARLALLKCESPR